MARSIEELTDVVTTQIGHYRSLKAALVDEARAAAQSDAQALAEAMRAKQERVALIREAETRICRLMAQLAPPGADTPIRLCELAASLPGPDGDRLKDLGRVLKTEATDLQRINRANADLIAHCLKLVKQSLDVLSNLLAPQLVYQPAGAPAHRSLPVHRFSQRA